MYIIWSCRAYVKNIFKVREVCLHTTAASNLFKSLCFAPLWKFIFFLNVLKETLPVNLNTDFWMSTATDITAISRVIYHTIFTSSTKEMKIKLFLTHKLALYPLFHHPTSALQSMKLLFQTKHDLESEILYIKWTKNNSCRDAARGRRGPVRQLRVRQRQCP